MLDFFEREREIDTHGYSRSRKKQQQQQCLYKRSDWPFNIGKSKQLMRI